MHCSVVVPCYNTGANLEALHARLTAVLGAVADQYDLIFVDDGSRDGTAAGLKRLAAADPHVRFVALSRNFGQEAALTAGLDRAEGDCVVLIDDDLQDPPEVIPDLIAQWQSGCEEVHAVRTRRRGSGVFNRAAAFLFYRLLNALSDTPVPKDTGNFRLLDRKVVLAFRQCREQGRFARALIPWLGFRQGTVAYERAPRHAGRGHYSLTRLLRLALDAVCGFSVKPLRLASLLGLGVTLVSFVVALIVVIQKLFFNLTAPGYALTTAGLFFLGGVQMLLLGIIGEYLGRVYQQVQDRPLYLVAEEGGGNRGTA